MDEAGHTVFGILMNLVWKQHFTVYSNLYKDLFIIKKQQSYYCLASLLAVLDTRKSQLPDPDCLLVYYTCLTLSKNFGRIFFFVLFTKKTTPSQGVWNARKYSTSLACPFLPPSSLFSYALFLSLPLLFSCISNVLYPFSLSRFRHERREALYR